MKRISAVVCLSLLLGACDGSGGSGATQGGGGGGSGGSGAPGGAGGSTTTSTTAATGGGSTTTTETGGSGQGGEGGSVSLAEGPYGDCARGPSGCALAGSICPEDSTGKVCAPPCETDADCPPPPPGASLPAECVTFNEGNACIAPCLNANPCPEEMLCVFLGAKPQCGWGH